MDGQARRSGTHRRRRWCNRGLVGLHAQVSAVAPNAPTDLPGSDSIRRPREGPHAGRPVSAARTLPDTNSAGPSHSSSVVVDRRERGRRLLAAVEAALPKPDIMPALQFVARVRQQPDLDEPVPLVQSDTGRVGQRDNPDRGPKTLAFQPGQQLGVQGVATPRRWHS